MRMIDTTRPTVEQLRSSVGDLIERWRREGRYQPRSDSWLRSFDVAFSKELAARGLIGMTWPREYGGGDFTNRDRFVVTEELLRAGAPVAAHWIADRQIGPAILRHGSAELRQEILPGIVSADYLFCLGMSEPEAGSDLAAVRTTATPVVGGWKLRGRKIWTTGAHRATHAYVLARTSAEERKHQGLSEFIVDMNSDGVLVSPIVDMAGDHHFNEVVFEDVFVPRARLLGVEGDGWRQVIEQLSFERGGPERVLSTYPLLADIVAHGELVRSRGGVDGLGELVARLAALRAMAFDVATQLDHGVAPVQEAATLKYLGNAFERDVVDYRRKVLGPGGPQSPYGQALLASPGFSLRGGAADVLLSIVVRDETAKGVDGGPRRGAPGGGDESHEHELVELVTGLAELPGHERWNQIRELGLVGIGIDEERGGSGGTFDDLLTVVHAFGRHGISTPLIEASLAASVLAEIGQSDLLATHSGDVTVAFADPAIDDRATTSPGWVVPYASTAGAILLIDHNGAVRCSPPEAVTISPGRTVAGEPLDGVTLAAGAELVRLGRVDATNCRTRLALLRSAALGGALDGAYQMTKHYVQTREQFGAPLVKIPAVAAHLATVKTHVLQAQAAQGRAVTLFGRVKTSAAERLSAAATARVIASRAAGDTARIAHQLHGAIGITQEYPLHRLTLRLWAWRDADLTEREWSALLGEHAVNDGEEALWSSLTGVLESSKSLAAASR